MRCRLSTVYAENFTICRRGRIMSKKRREGRTHAAGCGADDFEGARGLCVRRGDQPRAGCDAHGGVEHGARAARGGVCHRRGDEPGLLPARERRPADGGGCVSLSAGGAAGDGALLRRHRLHEHLSQARGDARRGGRAVRYSKRADGRARSGGKAVSLRAELRGVSLHAPAAGLRARGGDRAHGAHGGGRLPRAGARLRRASSGRTTSCSARTRSAASSRSCPWKGRAARSTPWSSASA